MGLDYGWNRYYSSTWGRFTTADPYVMSGGLGNPQGWNRYAYVHGDPVNFFDPRGLEDVVPTFQITVTAPAAVDLTNLCLDLAHSTYQSSSHPFGPFHNWNSAGYFVWQTACVNIGVSNGADPGEPHLQPPGTNGGDPNYLKRQVVEEARRRAVSLLRGNIDCTSIFGFVFDPASAMEVAAVNVMSSEAVPSARPGVGAFTTHDSGGAIFVLSNRYFFTNLLEDGSSATSSSEFSGLNMFEMQAAILIHELLHLTRVVGADDMNQQIQLPSGETVNGSSGVSRAVKKHCFRK